MSVLFYMLFSYTTCHRQLLSKALHQKTARAICPDGLSGSYEEKICLFCIGAVNDHAVLIPEVMPVVGTFP